MQEWEHFSQGPSQAKAVRLDGVLRAEKNSPQMNGLVYTCVVGEGYLIIATSQAKAVCLDGVLSVGNKQHVIIPSNKQVYVYVCSRIRLSSEDLAELLPHLKSQLQQHPTITASQFNPTQWSILVCYAVLLCRFSLLAGVHEP